MHALAILSIRHSVSLVKTCASDDQSIVTTVPEKLILGKLFWIGSQLCHQHEMRPGRHWDQLRQRTHCGTAGCIWKQQWVNCLMLLIMVTISDSSLWHPYHHHQHNNTQEKQKKNSWKLSFIILFRQYDNNIASYRITAPTTVSGDTITLYTRITRTFVNGKLEQKEKKKMKTFSPFNASYSYYFNSLCQLLGRLLSSVLCWVCYLDDIKEW